MKERLELGSLSFELKLTTNHSKNFKKSSKNRSLDHSLVGERERKRGNVKQVQEMHLS